MDLHGFIRDIPDFPKPGIVFKDITPLFLDPRALDHAIALLAGYAGELDVDYVVSAEARGFVLGGAIAARAGAGFIPARKPGKLPRETASVEYALEYGVDALHVHADSLAGGARARRGRLAGGVDQGAGHSARQAGARGLHARRGRPAAAGRVAPRARGIALRAHILVGRDGDRGEARGRGLGAGHPDRGREAARPLSAGRLPGEPRGEAPAGRGARRARARRGAGVNDRTMRFWGWGEPARPPHLSEPGLKLLRERTDTPVQPRRGEPVALDAVRLPDSRLSEQLATRLRARTDRDARVLHAAGKSYPDLIRMRSGEISPA